MTKSWNIDPKTGDYIMENGAPQETESLAVPAYIRLKTPRKKWLYAPNDKFGSDFYLVKKRQSTQDGTQFENIAANALAPIVNDGRANQIDVDTVALSRGGVGLKTIITPAGGEDEEIVFEGLGV